jgi:hypothetical protein
MQYTYDAMPHTSGNLARLEHELLLLELLRVEPNSINSGKTERKERTSTGNTNRLFIWLFPFFASYA